MIRRARVWERLVLCAAIFGVFVIGLYLCSYKWGVSLSQKHRPENVMVVRGLLHIQHTDATSKAPWGFKSPRLELSKTAGRVLWLPQKTTMAPWTVVSIPLWIPCLPFAAAMAWQGWVLVCRRRWVQCTSCGYELRGLRKGDSELACPECGAMAGRPRKDGEPEHQRAESQEPDLRGPAVRQRSSRQRAFETVTPARAGGVVAALLLVVGIAWWILGGSGTGRGVAAPPVVAGTLPRPGIGIGNANSNLTPTEVTKQAILDMVHLDSWRQGGPTDDGWDREIERTIVFSNEGDFDSVEYRSAGPDGVLQSADDIVFRVDEAGIVREVTTK